MPRHVFIDNSNIFGGAQETKKVEEPDVPWAALRLDFDNLFALLENGQDVGTRAFAGSGSETAEVIWSHARDRGYDTYILTRVETIDGRTKEQAVDEIIHLVIANAILDFSVPQTLVIASGDGKDSNFGTSFVSQVERALKWGWDVEVWSWSASMTERYRSLETRYTQRIRLRSLDPHYQALTLLTKGSFHHGDHVQVEVRGRDAKALAIVGETSAEARG